MKTIGLAPNPQKKEALQLTLKLAEWLLAKGIEPRINSEAADQIGLSHFGVPDNDMANVDLLLVLGGDGTMLRWCRIAAPAGTPMIGVNFGQYGFITEIQPGHVKNAIERILAGEYYVSERVLLQAVLTRNGKISGTYYALNDVVVSKGPLARMLGLDTYIGGKFIVTYAADGIIVSSPTGSTAYSLSAGGPVVHPDVRVLIITPICPHTLNARALVISDNESVGIVGQCGEGESQMMLTIDGQLGENLTSDDRVDICTAKFMARLVQLEQHSFYNKLQTRLRWGERFRM